MAEFHFWTHGLNAILRWPRGRLSGDPSATPEPANAIIDRFEHGTQVDQDENSHNTLFLVVPTPTVLDDEHNVRLKGVRLKALLGDKAHISGIQLIDGDDTFFNEPHYPDALRGRVDRHITLNREIQNALVVSFNVGYEADGERKDRRIIVLGAGAHFEN